MASHSSLRNWAKLFSLIHGSGQFLKVSVVKLALSTALLLISLEFLVFNQSTVILSDHTQGNKDFKAEQVLPIDVLLDQTPELSNSKVGHPLTAQERQNIIQILEEPTSTTSLVFAEVPKLILHDTAGELSNATIQEKKHQARGPIGDGAAAYVSRQGEITIVRPDFFDPRRPTATEYEKGADILSEATRNREARRVWQATPNSARKVALEKAVAGLNLDHASVIRRATIWLKTPSDQAFATLKARSLQLQLEGAKTTALWAIAEICNSVSSSPTSLANPSQALKTLKGSCQKLNPVFEESRQRVTAAVNIEIVQKRGSECWTTDAQVKYYNSVVADSFKISANRIVPFQTSNRPTYTPNQYESLARLYLQAALQAGQFPEITTHFWLDQGMIKKIGDHCDPRGLDLMQLYQRISAVLGYPQETLYGIKPQYGLNPEASDNVWWADQVLGTPHPSLREVNYH